MHSRCGYDQPAIDGDVDKRNNGVKGGFVNNKDDNVCFHQCFDSNNNMKHILRLVVRGDGGGGYCLVRMEWCPARWLVCLPLLIFPCTIKSRSSLLAPAHPGGPGGRAVKRL